MCVLTGIVFPSCSHGIRILWPCPTHPAPGELPACPHFKDHRTHIDFSCALCSNADISTQTDRQARRASLAPKHPDRVAFRAETHDETLERARLGRVASEERMRREGTTLEEENRRSRASKYILAARRRFRELVEFGCSCGEDDCSCGEDDCSCVDVCPCGEDDCSCEDRDDWGD